MSGDLFDSVGSGDEANREIRFGNGGDRTDVLLVDDDTQWARLMASDIEAASDDIEVTVAGSATEAMETFREQGQFDCLVADYQMPGADGIQLLERVRERRPQFPFLLVTSQGSEQVAERAIDAGVTDYLIKDFGADQATKFLSRIQTAVDHYRLQCALAESEERYRTVTEQSRDATATIQGGQLLFCNQRLVELTGRQRDHLRNSSDIVAEIVHEDDREQVRSVVDAWDETPDEARLHEARVVRPDGTVRHCEYTGGRIDHDGERATLVSIRDVTERQRRERELQWERELNRTIQRTLVESRSRDSLERSVTEQLQRHGYTLAWIGERIGDELVPRVVEGDRQYVVAIDRTIEASPTDDAVEGGSTDGTVEGGSTDGTVEGGSTDDAVEDSPAASEPSIRAVRTGEPQFTRQLGAHTAVQRSVDTVDRQYRSGAGIPLVYDDIPYGVLAVYTTAADGFDETEQRLLTELADTVALAIHGLETERSLAADRVVRATLQVDGGYYLLDLDQTGAFADCERVQVRGTVPLDDETVLQYLEIGGGEIGAVCESMTEHTAVRGVDVVADEDPSRLQVTVGRSVPEASLAARGALVRSTSIEAAAAKIETELPGRDDIRAAVSQLEDSYGTVSVRAIVDHQRTGDDHQRHTVGTTDLTQKQLNALRAAYYEGYFEQPRGSSATDIAESLGVSHSTFLRHLRTAHQKIFDAHFE